MGLSISEIFYDVLHNNPDMSIAYIKKHLFFIYRSEASLLWALGAFRCVQYTCHSEIQAE